MRSKWLSVEIHKQEAHSVRRNLHCKQAPMLRLEANHVRRPSTLRFAFTKRFDQIRRQQILDHTRNRRRTEARSPHEIRSRTRTRLSQKSQDIERIRATQDGRPTDCYNFSVHVSSLNIESTSDPSVALHLQYAGIRPFVQNS